MQRRDGLSKPFAVPGAVDATDAKRRQPWGSFQFDPPAAVAIHLRDGLGQGHVVQRHLLARRGRGVLERRTIQPWGGPGTRQLEPLDVVTLRKVKEKASS
jgi:hypothetical protein